MKKPIDKDSVFENEITKSILNLLEIYYNENGLRPVYIRYALDKNYREKQHKEPDPEFERNIDRIKELYEEKLKSFWEDKRILNDCIKSREQLYYYLRILENELHAIEKIGQYKKTKYKITERFYKELNRRENFNALNLFSSVQIKSYSNNSDWPSTSVLYGFSEKLLMKLGDKRKKIDTFITQIEKNIKEIDNIKQDIIETEKKRILKDFLNETESAFLKDFLKQNGDDIFGIIYNVFLNISDFSEKSIRENLLDSRYVYISSIKYGCTPHFNNNLDDFIKTQRIYKKSIDGLNEKEFCNLWSNMHFNKKYDFSKSDIEEIIEWGWQHRDTFKIFVPMSVAYSGYIESSRKSLNFYSITKH